MLNELQHLRPLNAGDRNRTGTVSLQQDFKSCASASSATPAYMIMGRGGFEPPKQVAADLQSVPFGHSGIHPCHISLTVMNDTTTQNKMQALFQIFSKKFSIRVFHRHANRFV